MAPPREYPGAYDKEVFPPKEPQPKHPNGKHANGADGDPTTARPRGGAKAKAPVEPFETFEASMWEGQPIEPRRYLVHNRIPLGEVGILSGDGGTGKTKAALQLGVSATANEPDWLGGVMDAHGPTIIYTSEEKLKEMHRRTFDIIEHRGLSFKDLKGLHFICDPVDVVLGRVDREGAVHPTLSLARLEKSVIKIRPVLIIIENAADVYVGNESDRNAVHQFVRALIGGLSKLHEEATPMLIQHPSVGGLIDGTGRSGSTGWNNAGRWRLNFTTIKDDDNDDDDDGLRQLHLIKTNYGKRGEKVRCRWQRGVFVPEGTISSPERAAAEKPIDDAFMRCMGKAEALGINISQTSGPYFAPMFFEMWSEAGGYKKKALEGAMKRLLLNGRIVSAMSAGAPSRQHPVIKIAEA
jgi:RecA-family ATPase